MINKKVKQKPTKINISTYNDIFELITLLTKKYAFPNMPKRYRFEHLYNRIEIGEIYKRRDDFPQRLYFAPEGFLLSSFYSFNNHMDPSTYNLVEILDYLYSPQQILRDFYLKLIKFSKERKKKIRGLKLALHFMKIIIENDEELRT